MTDFTKSVTQAAGALGAYVDVDLASFDNKLAALNNKLAALNNKLAALDRELADTTDEDHLAGLITLLDTHQVLFFPNQRLEASGFARIARRLGTVEAHPAYATVDGQPDVQILESTPDNPSKIEIWHSDMTFRPQPPSVTLLYARVVPDVGGDTLWASAAKAYETLSAPIRGLVDGLEAQHDFAKGFAESLAEPGGRERLADAVRANPPVRHPVVRTHPRTGRRSLYVNALFTSRLEGMRRAESSMLLELLAKHITADEHTVRLQWEPGTIAMWDNRTTQHKPVNDFFGQHRMMYRITVGGEKPT